MLIMKHIKLFEELKVQPRANISVGDYVKVYFQQDEIFKVIRVDISKNKYYLDQFGNDYFRRYQLEKVLSQPTPDEIEKYRMIKNMRKYNL